MFWFFPLKTLLGLQLVAFQKLSLSVSGTYGTYGTSGRVLVLILGPVLSHVKLDIFQVCTFLHTWHIFWRPYLQGVETQARY